MDANRDEAIRCIKIAEKHFIQGNLNEAKRFLLKSKKLCPNIKLNDQFASLFESESGGARRSPSRERSRPRSKERQATSTPTSPATDSGPKVFKKNDLDPIRRILTTRDHYQILGVPKTATPDEIKKAYKLLALKYHPDKNQAPGATEAFKKISNSADVLNDPIKRKRYDEFGNEEEAPNLPRRRGDVFYQYETHQGFDADVFNMFFNGGFPFAQFNHGRQQRQARNHDSERESNYFVYLQLLPLIILFALSFFSSLMVKDPYYSLQRTQKYPDLRFTQTYRVEYFVKPTFVQDFSGSLPQLERQVEEEYVTNLRYRCYREKETKEAMIFRARYYNDEEAFNRAQKTPVPSCDRLNKILQHGD